jgi:hypothetical protein
VPPDGRPGSSKKPKTGLSQNRIFTVASPPGIPGMAMKVQYFGDVNDFRKYALLRTLSEVGRFRVGVCWMLTVADGSGHGDNRGYLRQVDQWRRYDPALFDALASAPPKPTIDDLRRVENEALIPDATFFNDFTPDGLAERGGYHRACMNAFKACELTFFDPDNGLEVKSTAKGRKRSSKYAYLDEIDDHYAAGRSILLYQHFPRASREIFVGAKASRLKSTLAGSTIWSFETPHVVFLLAAGPNHVGGVEKAASALGERRCVPGLFSRVQVVPADDAAHSSLLNEGLGGS